jgi:hypothetical protein
MVESRSVYKCDTQIHPFSGWTHPFFPSEILERERDGSKMIYQTETEALRCSIAMSCSFLASWPVWAVAAAPNSWEPGTHWGDSLDGEFFSPVHIIYLHHPSSMVPVIYGFIMFHPTSTMVHIGDVYGLNAGWDQFFKFFGNSKEW